MDLRRQSAAGPADRLMLNPPFPPAECWCTRMIVASILTFSKSGSSERACRSRCHTPRFVQRENRRKILFQFPHSFGKSRQGAPVFAKQRTASTNNRLSFPCLPGSPSLPGTSGSIRFHCSSVRRCLCIQGSTQDESLNQNGTRASSIRRVICRADARPPSPVLSRQGRERGK